MKNAVHNLVLLTLILSALTPAAAQKANYSVNGGMTIGFGLGASYQQSDIANSRGAGFDFTLGSYLYRKENAFLAADWKFRFLAGLNTAHDHRINPDTTFSNIRYDFFNYDLELGLTLNRLRERTRIVITGFAGAGITHGRTFTDLYDANGDLYDYTVIDQNQDRAQVYADLISLSDKDYETRLLNKAAIMPTLGIYLGYQFSHSFSMGIEHKTNFSLSEHNSITGIDLDNNIIPGSKKDRNHYTTLGFKWSLGGRSAGAARRNSITRTYTSPITTRPVNPVTPVVRPANVTTVPSPFVDITVPSGSIYSTTAGKLDISARVQNVRNRQGIQVILNNNNVGFEFDAGSGNIRSTLNLINGTNTLVVTGTNESGSARDNVSIIFNRPAQVASPTVRFINPANPATVDNNIFGLRVQTANVKAWQDITVSVNGERISNFNFSNEGVVTTNIGLKEGLNRIEVSGKNESGVATERSTITYVRPVKTAPPVVNITAPGTNPFNTSEARQEIKAIISGVQGRENISVSVNGSINGNFSYDISTLSLSTFISLREGQNVINITAKNQAGQDAKSVTIIKETVPCSGPTLTMAAPAQDGITTDNQSYTFRVVTGNVAGRNQFTVNLNGRNISSFNFNGNELICPASLEAGSNNFTLVAKNDCGTQTISASVIYRPPVVVVEPTPCPKPVLDYSVTAVNRQDATHELKGSLRNVKNRSEIRVTINGNPFDAFQFVPSSGEISAALKLNPGSYTVAVAATTSCGTDSRSAVVSVAEPCVPPQVNMNVIAVSRQDATHELKGSVRNVKNRSEIRVTINGNPFDAFQFVPSSGEISAVLKLYPGSYTVAVDATTSCGTDSRSAVVSVAEPCVPPQVTMNVMAVSRQDATHELKGSVRNVKNRSEVKVTINGNPFDAFQFVPSSGEISAALKLNPGNNTINVTAKNDCGEDSGSRIVAVEEEKPCGPRINPGNSAWQFCLVTNSGTFTRENLTNNNFSYSGPASSLFFLPIGGGGDVMVNGKPYVIKPGQYYLFSGNLTVTVSTKNPGSMGQWSVCIVADKEPVYGNGNNRPKSPCEETQEDIKPKRLPW